MVPLPAEDCLHFIILIIFCNEHDYSYDEEKYVDTINQSIVENHP